MGRAWIIKDEVPPFKELSSSAENQEEGSKPSHMQVTSEWEILC